MKLIRAKLGPDLDMLAKITSKSLDPDLTTVDFANPGCATEHIVRWPWPPGYRTQVPQLQLGPNLNGSEAIGTHGPMGSWTPCTYSTAFPLSHGSMGYMGQLRRHGKSILDKCQYLLPFACSPQKVLIRLHIDVPLTHSPIPALCILIA